jgi:hypothetical protein
VLTFFLFLVHHLLTEKQLCSGTATRKTSSAKCLHVTSSRASLRTTETAPLNRSFEEEVYGPYEAGPNSHALRLLHFIRGLSGVGIGWEIHTGHELSSGVLVNLLFGCGVDDG